jgi:hypothetical protein
MNFTIYIPNDKCGALAKKPAGCLRQAALSFNFTISKIRHVNKSLGLYIILTKTVITRAYVGRHTCISTVTYT